MNILTAMVRQSITVLLIAMLLNPNYVFAAELPVLLDDFNHSTNNSLGLARQFMNDTVAGGKTQSEVSIDNGVMHLSGELVPPRGQPAWASAVLLLDGQGQPQDASSYSGIRMKVKINHGLMSVSANSTEITNFDYHAAMVVVQNDGQFHEIKIPFASMARAWSEQTALNPQTINSLSIVAFGMQKSSYDFFIDEVGFY